MTQAATRASTGEALPGLPSGCVRLLGLDDIPAIAAMFAKTFAENGRKPGAELPQYLRRLFLEPLQRGSAIGSLVHLDGDGRINGFIGVLPIPYRIAGASRMAALCSTLMVDDRDADPFAGARLLRGVLAGPQDITLSETANAISQGMWRRARGSVLLDYSFEWRRVFRPFAFGACSAAVRNPRWARLLQFTHLGDRLAARHARFAAPAPSVCRDEPIDDAAFTRFLEEFTAHHDAAPDWSELDLPAMLDDARSKPRLGKMVVRAVYRGEVPIGVFVYHARPNEIGYVLQIAAARGRMQAVVDHLFDHACRRGLAGLRGRSQPELLDAMLSRSCRFALHTASVAHARDPRLLDGFRSGSAFFNGFAGESWTRLIGDDFA